MHLGLVQEACFVLLGGPVIGNGGLGVPSPNAALPTNGAPVIQVGSPTPRSTLRRLETPGAFAWWYVDCVDDNGNGVVAIWAWNLPFLPGLASAERRGELHVPRQRPSLNLAVYKEGREVAYVLQELDEHQASWDGGSTWTFGRSVIRRNDGARTTLSLKLDLPVAGGDERLRAQIDLHGAPTRSPVASEGAPHVWTPVVAAARGTFAVSVGRKEVVRGAGRAYHDRNEGDVPFGQIGVKQWEWARAPLQDRERIVYVLSGDDGAEPTVVGVDAMTDGTLQVVEGLSFRGRTQRTLYGMSYRPNLGIDRDGQPWLDVRNDARTDDGPFYLRFVTRSVAWDSGIPQSVRGVSEVIRPDRIDLARHRPLVSMRVVSGRKRPSMWLPLFSGTREDRLSRLFRWWAPTSRARVLG